MKAEFRGFAAARRELRHHEGKIVEVEKDRKLYAFPCVTSEPLPNGRPIAAIVFRRSPDEDGEMIVYRFDHFEPCLCDDCVERYGPEGGNE